MNWTGGEAQAGGCPMVYSFEADLTSWLQKWILDVSVVSLPIKYIKTNKVVIIITYFEVTS